MQAQSAHAIAAEAAPKSQTAEAARKAIEDTGFAYFTRAEKQAETAGARRPAPLEEMYEYYSHAA
ncbi:hypothetical protein [Halodurantibacterium flavum]|uniref:Uncharacterized protein n=1 Tax=Halodurantibacterium flavum TaxID=1382802 RepID=A0ABW4S6G4_9RHOB